MKGLLNLGNTCYINSVLQILLNLSDLYPALQKNPAVQSNFRTLYEAYWRDENKAVPVNLVKSFIRGTGLFTGQQGDQHEFLAELLNILHEEFHEKIELNFDMNQTGTALTLAALRNFQCQGMNIQADVNLSGQAYGYTSPVVSMFTGQQQSETVCECGAVTHCFDVFRTLELPIAGSSLDDCLNRYTAIEAIPDFHCDTCHRVTLAANRTTFWYLPHVLTFAVKRTVYAAGQVLKNNTVLTAPTELNLKPFMASGVAAPQYSLFAIANHHGQPHYGHCFATVHTATGWHILNDHLVQAISERIDNPTDYIYCYIRVSL